MLVRPVVMRHVKGARNNTPSLATSKRLFGFLTDSIEERQSASVDCIEINSGKVGISAFSFSVMPAVMLTSKMQGTNDPLGSSMNSRVFMFVLGAHVNIS